MAKAKPKAKAKGGKKKPKAMTKSALFAHLAEKTSLTKKQIEAVFGELTTTIVSELGTVKLFTLPGLFKLRAVEKAAVAGGEQKENKLKPGTFYTTQPKPASTTVRARPLKALKEALPAPK